VSEKPNSTAATTELSDEQLDNVSGGFVIYGRSALLPAGQIHATSPLLGGPDTMPNHAASG
jgi:bacteriocin-like protein